MKTFLFIVAIGFCMISCKKEKPISPGLFGKWELRRMYGGFSWRDSTYKPGNGNIYQFKSDSTYELFTDGKATETGVYEYRKNGYDGGGSIKYDELLFNSTTYGTMVILNGTKLTLGNTWTDGIATDYVKISDQ